MDLAYDMAARFDIPTSSSDERAIAAAQLPEPQGKAHITTPSPFHPSPISRLYSDWIVV